MSIALAYCAGIVDGEGYLGIKRSKAYKCQDRQTEGYHACIQVRMVDEPAIRFVSETMGGWYYKEKPHANNGRRLYCWQVTDKSAEMIIRRLLPYLKVKQQQGQLVLSLRALQSSGWAHRTKVVGYRNFPNQYGTIRRIANKAFSDEYVAKCYALWHSCRLLNGLARLSQ